MRIAVLGGGLVGSAIARDLAHGGEFSVTVFDMSEAALGRLAGVPGLATVRADLSDPSAVTRAAADSDLVVGAVPGHMGLATLRAVIESGRDVVDISFFPEDPFVLDRLAKEKGVRAVMDCGVAPGCSNLILGRMEAEFDALERFVCYVGGLPAVRTWPWEYKAPFSPADVIEEYTRPARYLAHGRLVTMPALSEPELLDFPAVGTLEAFNTDGLRSLLHTVKVPFMIEKTMRYPGHIDKIRVLRESGFLGTEPVVVGGASVRPIDLTSRLLFASWKLGEGEEDLTVMRVVVEGRRGGTRRRLSFDLFDRYDRATRTSSMARTTGYTCTAGVRLLARGLYTRKGISPPEFIGREPACYDFMFAELARRGVVFHRSETDRPDPAA
ncbi:MAG TPA: saccharopine dehydrogenase C-terminal domain-containing protein [Thermoanaerobaculaceae bacterium]|nr:saccharopine dehydrogenase C-terminal domain-containing protein [Thermoanaerobaculaceae bacterium]